MSLLVVGSIALDTVETPHGRCDEVLGGSATYFSCAARHFTDVRLVGVVGRDFPDEHPRRLRDHGIDIEGLQVADGDTFRWHGRYTGDMGAAETIDVKLNVLGTFDPTLPDRYRATEFVFLANASPVVQMKVLDQMSRPTLTVADTMNFYIDSERDALAELMGRVDGMVLNDGEARMFSEQANLLTAGRMVLELGPRFVIIKRGEHGATLFTRDGVYPLCAYPTERVVDPTGAGDSFAGGLMGFLASQGRWDTALLRLAMAYGTICASFDVQDFSLRALERTTRSAIDERLNAYRQMTSF